MPWMSKRRFIKRITFNTFKLLLILFVIIFIIGPVIFRYCYKLQESLIFSSFVNIPWNLKSAASTIKGLRNFYIKSDVNVKLGVWQILPETLLHNETITDTYFENALNNGQGVIIYYHGNSANRAADHRIQLYKILRKHFHVVTFDYRSYGDSSNVAPTEESVVRDCIAVYKWVSNRTSSNIFVWGHSLGTGLSLHMLSILNQNNVVPAGLILESPFSNMRDEISEHPLAFLFRSLPWFQYTITDSMLENNFVFASDKHILNVICPIIILHAEDDRVVPYKLGQKLYQKKLQQSSHDNVEFVGFPKKFGYGHKCIYKAPELSNIILNFTKKAIEEKKT